VPVLLESGLPTCLAWLEKKLEQLQLQAHQVASKEKFYDREAVVLQYLLPCYLSLLDNVQLEGRGIIFLYQVVLQILLKYEEKLPDLSRKRIGDIQKARTMTWRFQNKVFISIRKI